MKLRSNSENVMCTFLSSFIEASSISFSSWGDISDWSFDIECKGLSGMNFYSVRQNWPINWIHFNFIVIKSGEKESTRQLRNH